MNRNFLAQVSLALAGAGEFRSLNLRIITAGRRFWRRPDWLVVLLLALLMVPLLSQRTRYDGKTIKSIRFSGVRNADTGELYALLSMRVNKPLAKESINSDVKALFKTGYFSNVILRMQLAPNDLVMVTFEVVELPRVNLLEVRGAEELYPSDLKKLVPIKEGDVFSLQKVREGVGALKRKYVEEGFFLAEVWYRIGTVNAKTNNVDVFFVVDEGEHIPIAKINILGTRHLDPEDILDSLEQKESGLIENGEFRESKFEEDKYKILAYAKSRGFLDAEIDPAATGFEMRWKNPSRPQEGRVVVVTYRLIENEIRYFGGYSLEHDPRHINVEANPPERKLKSKDELQPIYKPAELLKFMEYSKDDVGVIFDEGKYFRDRGLVQEFYSRQGYVFAQVQPVFVNVPLKAEAIAEYKRCLALKEPGNDRDRRCKQEAGWLDLGALEARLKAKPKEAGRIVRHVHFVVRENGLAYIESIIIKGMVKTQESVIRRELLVKEGQRFNSALVQRTRERISNLGYFKEVNVKSTPGSDETKMNLILDVVEQPTGTISMGGGFGSQSGFSIFTEVGENNLNGTGQRISGRLEYGPLRRQVRISWTDPWIYEACLTNTGSFWRKKRKAFDEAPDLETIERVAATLQNNYREYGKLIRGYVRQNTSDTSIEYLDSVKVRVRHLLSSLVLAEEECYRSSPRPWSLSVSAFWELRVISNAASLVVSNDTTDNLVEESSYDKTRVGFAFGTSHSFLLTWAHYHSYSPSWSVASRPTALVSSAILRDVELGYQFRSSLRNGIVYDTRDSVFNPTTGLNLDFSLEMVGQLLGGQDHFNRYRTTGSYYWWWFDYTFGGLFRANTLRRWRVVQELRFSGVFTHETAPWSGNPSGRPSSFDPLRKPIQNKEVNPFIEPEERLFMGGYETLRGYDYFTDSQFPRTWHVFGGGSHMLLGSAELRFPIEPSVLWFVFFFDSGALYNNVGELTGDEKEFVDTYEEAANTLRGRTDPLVFYYTQNFNAFSGNQYPYGPINEWNNPKRSVLSQRNVALDRALYSWGFGLRIQIPVLPLRLFMAQKMYYKGNGKFAAIPGEEKFNFVFGIGDVRF